MKKKMNAAKKENLKNIFGSLISNRRVIDGARHNRWWVALIMFVLGVTIPVIPITVNASMVSGTEFFNNGTRGFESTITAFTLDMENKGISLEIDEDHKLVDVGDAWKNTYTYYNLDNKGLEYTYVNENTAQIDLAVYVVDPIIYGTDFNNAVNDILAKEYIAKSAKEYVEVEGEEKLSTYRPDTIIFGEQNVVLVVCKTNSTEAYGTVNGDYMHTSAGTSFKDFALINGEKANINNTDDIVAVKNNWINFFIESSTTIKDTNTLANTFLSLGINIALVAFMGLMVFLLTRGKKNVYHIFTFGDCEKISSWASISPALLALALGFMFANFAMMFFIILLGLRIMFLAMKQLKPMGR
ncbi:MAG: hypothetical protein LBM03_01295 [Erysipelotrichaceae bacterium]|jgi:hypothetical protein|nr:hypothetical protein [Erysipelotrichaceae bacterium]